jgi:hypothetical protein
MTLHHQILQWAAAKHSLKDIKYVNHLNVQARKNDLSVSAQENSP